jgi:hypothetical protein
MTGQRTVFSVHFDSLPLLTISNDSTALCKSIHTVSNLLNALFLRIQRHPSIRPPTHSSFIPPNSVLQTLQPISYLPNHLLPTDLPTTDNRSRYDPHRVVAVSDTVRATAGYRAIKREATGRSERLLLIHTDSKH